MKSKYKSCRYKGKRMRYHRMLLCQLLESTSALCGRTASEQYHNLVIHHIDGNGHNNSKRNIKVMTRSEHARYHAVKYMKEHGLTRDKKGRFV